MDAVNNTSFPKPSAYSSAEPGSSFFDPHFNFTGRSVEVAPQHSSQMVNYYFLYCSPFLFAILDKFSGTGIASTFF